MSSVYSRRSNYFPYPSDSLRRAVDCVATLYHVTSCQALQLYAKKYFSVHHKFLLTSLSIIFCRFVIILFCMFFCLLVHSYQPYQSHFYSISLPLISLSHSLSHSRFLSLFFFYHPFSPLSILSMILFLLPIDYLLFSVICKTCQPVVEGTGDEQLDRDILKTLLARPLQFSVSRFCDGERERATVNVANIAFTPPFFVRIALNHFSLYCSTFLYCVVLYNAMPSYIVLSRTIVLYCLL